MDPEKEEQTPEEEGQAPLAVYWEDKKYSGLLDE